MMLLAIGWISQGFEDLERFHSLLAQARAIEDASGFDEVF
jgi:hypothetical protein